MRQQGREGRTSTGVYLSPMAQRRAEFEDICGMLFARLELADGIDAAADLVKAAQPDLLVLDLDRFAPGIDLEAMAALVALRAGALTLLLCPFGSAGWIPALMAAGIGANMGANPDADPDAHGVHYAITPAPPERLRVLVEAQLDAPAGPADAGLAGARSLLALRARVQATLREADDPTRLAEALCEALGSWPGVVHAAVLRRQSDGDLQIEAQLGAPGLALGGLLQRTERLLQAPLRHAFPGLLAAAGGELVLLDDPSQAGEPDMAVFLREHGVALAAGLPIPADGPGAPRGALSLLMDSARAWSRDEWDTLLDIARLAAAGFRMAELHQENETLLARLTHVSTVDALTGVANRRHGEELLEKEIRRARRYRVPLALLAFDIDRFKAINDNYGHPVGDVVLRAVAEVTRAVLRTSDVLVRSGGQEFQILAPHTSAIDGLKVAEKIRHAIAQAVIPGVDHVTVSLGVAQLGEQESADSLAQRVDAAMRRAKRAGRNCVELAMQ
ncbi:GGDEF domain-containing protein [Massilia sp. 9096]|uniref:GGDEF domain-containing protein n=1 Tax=Massilia sp. 9096 TaxID=1500894 RepID=UPI0005603655|nr:GGDEF domain-containing protein [Massilia sp. 9096]